MGTRCLKGGWCHGRDSNNDCADFSQLGGGVDFSLNVTDMIITVMVWTFSRLGGGADFPTLEFPSSVLAV
jgi:hypothetical protein